MTALSTRPDRAGRISQRQALALWESYRNAEDLREHERLRNRLVMTFAPLVKYLVFKKIREVPVHLDVDDFISAGLEGMIKALDRYDPERGATLEQFLWTRAHGAVLDELRRQDWAPRSVRRFDREVVSARGTFRALHGREATTGELADALAVPVERLRDHRDHVRRADVGSLNSAISTEDGEEAGDRLDNLVAGDERSRPESATMLSSAKAELRAALDALPERDRKVLVLLYVENLTLSEIGEILGVSESRVSQIHSKLRKKLREQIGDPGDILDLL
jgi:RNA polymerase sigma factor for flagellar operon FliA